MTNFEFWKDKLEKLKKYRTGVEKTNGIPYDCYDLPCKRCLFGTQFHEATGTFTCTRERINKDGDKTMIGWLLEEHSDKPNPTLKKRERDFCEYMEHGYIARNRNGLLRAFQKMPKKNLKHLCWLSASGDYIALPIKDVELFPFIGWEDDEPWAVEDLLKLEVQEDE